MFGRGDVAAVPAMQRVAQSSVSTTVASGYGSCKGGRASGSATAASEVMVYEQFPAGLRVLVVDDDITCLRIIEQMLHRCRYHGRCSPIFSSFFELSRWLIMFYLLFSRKSL